jgi:hypothetical protein
MKKLRTLGNKILFQFVEVTVKGKKGTFEDITDWGFDCGNSFDASAKMPRWGTVVAIGPDIIDEGIVPGAKIFIEELKWTNEVSSEGEPFWQTDESCVLGIEAI